MKKFLYILLASLFVASCSVDQLDAGLEGPQGIQGEQGIPGQDGKDGQDGADGASAYDISLANGFEGTVADWLNSLIGADGKNGEDGKDGVDGQNGFDGNDGINGTNGTNGTNGVDGASAYELAFEEGFEGTLSEWLLSLVGETGVQGQQGPEGRRGPRGYNGSDGVNGTNGIDGEPGPPGADGQDAPIYDGDIIEFVNAPCDDTREVLMKVTSPNGDISFYGVYFDSAAQLAYWYELDQSKIYVTTDGTICVFKFEDGYVVAISDKTVVCHNPSGQNPQTKLINTNALQGHLGHGDYHGVCVN